MGMAMAMVYEQESGGIATLLRLMSKESLQA